jgi:hypothetical protein
MDIMMNHRLLVLVTVMPLNLAPVFADDRPVTDDERTNLLAALSAEGCEGGKLEFDDDGHYEVDDARCSDGRRYDLKLDTAFKLIKKELDD